MKKILITILNFFIDIKDKDDLIKHVKSAYDDVLASNGSLILTVQSIVNSVVHYTKSNNLDYKVIIY